jgi:hypothetical protein
LARPCFAPAFSGFLGLLHARFKRSGTDRPGRRPR